MPHTKRASKRKGRKEAMPAAGAVGVVSLLLAGGASAATAIPTPSQRTAPPQITLSEEEITESAWRRSTSSTRKTREHPGSANDLPQDAPIGAGAARRAASDLSCGGNPP
jgi:hypothetical protein